MNIDEKKTLLQEQIAKSLLILDEIKVFYSHLKNQQLPEIGNTQISATLFSEVFVSFYTCCETVFVRISKFFENNIDKEHWHRDILDRMTLEIHGIRPRVISDETKLILDEILRFRHFKRYYFEFKYDWTRIEYLDKQFVKGFDNVKNDLSLFSERIKNI